MMVPARSSGHSCRPSNRLGRTSFRDGDMSAPMVAPTTAGRFGIVRGKDCAILGGPSIRKRPSCSLMILSETVADPGSTPGASTRMLS